jgi:hypothetical protein
MLPVKTGAVDEKDTLMLTDSKGAPPIKPEADRCKTALMT